jgi:hypothetical protein
MFKSLRWTERFFRLGLWLVALSFASFLNTLGTRLIEELNLPAPSETDFMDPVRLKEFYAQHDQAVAEQFKIEEKLSKARHEHVAAKANTEAASDTFRNWVSTREATARPDQDRELIARTRALDALRGVERNALARVQDIQVDFEEVQRKRSLVSDKFTALQKLAAEPYDAALAKIQRREFVARISVLLAVMALAIWLWTKQRKSRWWPFVWGYIWFAAFAFYVQALPYLPLYDEYVRSILGICITLLIGWRAIVSLQRYRVRQAASEGLPDGERRALLGYERALARLKKGVCPGCERRVDLKDEKTDYCPHCGIGPFGKCYCCSGRKSMFNRFCFACGTSAADVPAD